ncbi:MAG: hypothetical protein ABH816_00125 [Candidatus Levyibacteriota bacterium]
MKDFLLKIKKQNLLFFIPIFLLVLLLALYLVDNDLKRQINSKKINIPPFSVNSSSFPVLTSASESSKLNISAKAYVILDNDSKVILSSKNPNLRFSMASTTKIMTALTALNFYKMSDILTIKTNDVEGEVLELKKDDRFLFEELLYAMLLPSANDAALAIAQNYPGGEKAFVEKMNENAKNFHLSNTHFADPAGLEDDEDYTTVIELARLSSIALKNKEFAKIVSTKHKSISNIDKTKSYPLDNLNILLGKDGVNGIKTGFTQEAGGVLVTSKIKDGHNLIIVVMKSQDRFFDTQELLSLIDGNLKFLNFNY